MSSVTYGLTHLLVSSSFPQSNQINHLISYSFARSFISSLKTTKFRIFALKSPIFFAVFRIPSYLRYLHFGDNIPANSQQNRYTSLCLWHPEACQHGWTATQSLFIVSVRGGSDWLPGHLRRVQYLHSSGLWEHLEGRSHQRSHQIFAETTGKAMRCPAVWRAL